MENAGQVQVLDVVEVISPVEMRLADGRLLRLAYLQPADSPQTRKEAMERLKYLCLDSNFVVLVPSRANSEGYARNVLEDSPQRLVALVSIRTGTFILADLRLATVDLASDYQRNSLYRAEEEYLRAGTRAH